MPLPEIPSLSRRNLLRGGFGLAGLVGAGPLLAACSGDGSSDGVAADGTVSITMWHGQADQGKETWTSSSPPSMRRTPRSRSTPPAAASSPTACCRRSPTALASGYYPDIAYIFGPDIASVARSPQGGATSTDASPRQPDCRWDDFYPAARDAVTVDGDARGFPALVDNLCVAYNKKVFERRRGADTRGRLDLGRLHGRPREALTDPAKGIFGTGWPADGGEDCVWRIYPLIWDLGGDIVTEDGKKVAFDGGSGLKALATINQLGQGQVRVPRHQARQRDDVPDLQQRQDGHGRRPVRGSCPTSSRTRPTTASCRCRRSAARTSTIAGPDTWTVFDNGAGAGRRPP